MNDNTTIEREAIVYLCIPDNVYGLDLNRNIPYVCRKIGYWSRKFANWVCGFWPAICMCVDHFVQYFQGVQLWLYLL